MNKRRKEFNKRQAKARAFLMSASLSELEKEGYIEKGNGKKTEHNRSTHNRRSIRESIQLFD